MNKYEIKRLAIFEKYSDQLHRLVDLGLYKLDLKFDRTYICPICMEQFSLDDLDTSSANHLTLEDAPPKSLGGKANTLTCKNCNNQSGHKIDFHLLEHLNELGIRNFSPNTGSKVQLLHNGNQVQGTVNVDEKGNITIIHSEKVNNPKNLQGYIKATGKGDVVEIKFPSSRVQVRRFETALLKTAYIMAFEQFGYALILHDSYDIIRQQICNPDDELYPTSFWSQQSSVKKAHEGVYFIKTSGFEGFHAMFVLKNEDSETGYIVYLPVSAKTLKLVVKKLKQQEAGLSLSYESYEADSYFDGETNIKMMVDYLNIRSTKSA